MAYIGAEPVPGQNREVDDISSGFNGNATAFTLQVSSVNVSPESANNILINLGGVLQNPGTDYTIAASTITFTTAPASGLSFFGLILGAGINTATVADQTIGTSKVVDNAITADKLAHTSVTAGSYTTADITVDAQGRITAAASGTIANAEIADGAVNNAKVDASAAIAGTKISPDFGSQNVVTTGTLGSGAITTTGSINISSTSPQLTFTDTNHDPDYVINADGGFFHFRDQNAGTNLFSLGATTVFNEAGANIDFRIEGDSDANLFNLDASADAIGIGAAPNTTGMKMEISRSTSDAFVNASDCVLRLLNTDTSANTNQTSLQFTTSSTGSGADSAIVSQAENASGNSRLEFWTDTSNGMTEKMVINSAGNVGIGTSTINDDADHCKLAISGQSGTAAGILVFQDTSNNEDGMIFADDGSLVLSADRSNATSGSTMQFRVDGSSEKMRIDSSGQVGIGVTSPNDKLHVLGSVTFRNESTNIGSSQLFLDNNESGGAYRVRFDADNDLRGSITVNSSGVTYNTSSDYRLKENITAISDGITRLKTLKPSRFNWKKDSSTTVDGFIAHEVTAVPEAVIGTKDAVATEDSKDHKKGDPIYQQIDQSKLVPLLTAALQEAVTKIETLETKVAALEAA